MDDRRGQAWKKVVNYKEREKKKEGIRLFRVQMKKTKTEKHKKIKPKLVIQGEGGSNKKKERKD